MTRSKDPITLLMLEMEPDTYTKIETPDFDKARYTVNKRNYSTEHRFSLVPANEDRTHGWLVCLPNEEQRKLKYGLNGRV